MEEFDAINTGLSTIRQIVPMFRSLLEKAPQEGASKEFTRQLNEAVINMQQAVIDAQEMVLAGQATEAKLRSRLQDLEQQTARAERWAEEISRYKLVKLPRNGGMAYALCEELRLCSRSSLVTNWSFTKNQPDSSIAITNKWFLLSKPIPESDR